MLYFDEILAVRRKAEICLSNFFVRHRAKQRYPQPTQYPHRKLSIPETLRSTKGAAGALEYDFFKALLSKSKRKRLEKIAKSFRGYVYS